MTTTPEAARRLAHARELLSVPTPTLSGRYPVEHDPIRRYCHMVDDTNPAYLDSGAVTPHGRNLCPPSLVPYFALPGPWPPGAPAPFPPLPVGTSRLNVSITTRWRRPVRVGDRLSCRFRYVDVFHKAIRADPDAIWYVLERTIWNADGDEVCTQRDTAVAFTPLDPAPPTPAEEAGTDRGAEQSRTDRPDDLYRLVFRLDARRLMLAVSGSQDLYELHYDVDYARERGQPAPVVSNVFLRAAVDRLVSDRLPDGRLTRLDIRIRRPVLGGDTLVVGLRSADDDGDHTALQIEFATGRGQCATAVAHVQNLRQGARSA